MNHKRNKKLKPISKTKKEKRNLNTYKSMMSTIEGYGFKYSFSGFLKQMLLFLGGIIILGYSFKMKVAYLAILSIFSILMMPIIIKNQFKFIYEQNRFNELVIYLEQMAYSFKKKPKILTALEDTYSVSSGQMKKDIKKGIGIIEKGTSDNLYKDAFYTIEKHFTCSRILSLHKFLIKIEENGGEFSNSMDILIDDFSDWSRRTYKFQKGRANIKLEIMIGIIATLLVSLLVSNMVPSEYSFTGNDVYQFTTLALFIIFIAVYTISQSKLNGSWLKNDSIKNDKKILKDYEIVQQVVDGKDKRKLRKKMIILSPCLVLGIYFKSIPLIICIGFLMYFVWTQPKNNMKYARKRTVKEITKEVPGWCREIALNLQTENVYMAIANTQNDCPTVLRGPLKRLLLEIDENPQSVVPYNDFLSEFNIPEINRMMKTLYSLTEYGVSDAEAQINKIVEQNNAMLAKAEEIKNDDSLAGIGFLTKGPMLIGALKMMIDMTLMVSAFSNISSGIL